MNIEETKNAIAAIEGIATTDRTQENNDKLIALRAELAKLEEGGNTPSEEKTPQQCGVIVGKVLIVGETAKNGNVPITIDANSAKAARSMQFAGISQAQHNLVIVWMREALAERANVGGMATISIEARIKGVTGYTSNDVWTAHTKDHFSIQGFPTFAEHELVSETKAINGGKFDWLQEIGVSREEAVDTVKSRITF